MTISETLYMIYYMPPMGLLAGLFIAGFMYWFSTE